MLAEYKKTGPRISARNIDFTSFTKTTPLKDNLIESCDGQRQTPEYQVCWSIWFPAVISRFRTINLWFFRKFSYQMPPSSRYGRPLGIEYVVEPNLWLRPDVGPSHDCQSKVPPADGAMYSVQIKGPLRALCALLLALSTHQNQHSRPEITKSSVSSAERSVDCAVARGLPCRKCGAFHHGLLKYSAGAIDFTAPPDFHRNQFDLRYRL